MSTCVNDVLLVWLSVAFSAPTDTSIRDVRRTMRCRTSIGYIKDYVAVTNPRRYLERRGLLGKTQAQWI